MEEFGERRPMGFQPEIGAGVVGKRPLLDNPSGSDTDGSFSSKSPFFEPAGGMGRSAAALLDSESGLTAKHFLTPAAASFRRTRAETFSSFPSRLLPGADEPLAPGSLVVGGGAPVSGPAAASHSRVRSGSLSLLAPELAGAFGIWNPSSYVDSMHGFQHQPSGLSAALAGEGEEGQVGGRGPGSDRGGAIGTGESRSAPGSAQRNMLSAQAAFESVQISEETSAVARTLDYLGLDDHDNGRGPTPSQGGSPSAYPVRQASNSSVGNQYLRGQQPASPKLQGQGTDQATASAGPPFPSLVAQAIGNRVRSYSVAVGENLAVSDGVKAVSTMGLSSPGSTYATHGRARASSIAFLESSASSFRDHELELQMNVKAYSGRKEGPASNEGEPNNSPRDQYELGFEEPPTIMVGSETVSGPGTTQTPTRSLWIGNVDPSLSPADLLTFFGPFGPVESLRILPEKECAFINFVRIEDAIAAREEMHGARVAGTSVRLGYGRAEAIGDSLGMQPTKSLWIGNIPPTTDPSDLESIFSAYGPVESARVLTHKNCGFVNFDRLEDAMEARKSMNGKEISGSVVKIGYAKVPSKSELAAAGMLGLGGVSVNFMSGGGGYGDQLSNAFFMPASPIAAPGSVISGLLNANGQPPALCREGSNPGATFTTPSRPHRENSSTSVTPLTTATDGETGSPPSAQDAAIISGIFNGGSPDDGSVPATFSLEGGGSGMLEADKYAPCLPPLPEPSPNRQVDQNRLREMRKRLDSHISQKEVDAMFAEILPECVDLCTDYIGNVVIQKVLERSGDHHRLLLLEAVSPHMAVIGVHKNGTWVIQKMIDLAKTPTQMACVVNALKQFTPPLLLDQFGNYVVQCCLRMGAQKNQFVFDAMHTKCIEIGTGRFGARAMRACLESQYTTKRQQKHVAIAIVSGALQLVTNPNGSILITWLLDTSSLPGRYRVLAPKLAPHVHSLCNHKLASATILKLVNQRVELDARDIIIRELFFRDEASLRDVILDQVQGVSVIQKILATACVSADEKVRLADRCRSVLSRIASQGGPGIPTLVKENQMGFKRLLDELAVIPSSLSANGAPPLLMLDPSSNMGGLSAGGYLQHDIVSPLTPHAGGGFFPSGNASNGYYPTPGHSPQQMYSNNGMVAPSHYMPSPGMYGGPQYGGFPSVIPWDGSTGQNRPPVPAGYGGGYGQFRGDSRYYYENPVVTNDQ
ncbi:hypothetical protein HK101_006085 [Irineochytrium annulatum]|nr:hypothetical protein HK101_006085 [Irineochytrium annulatum]